jgi:molybdate transport system regulatory protein
MMHAPAVRLRVDFGPGRAVGPGKIALLEQIARGGSLSQAARALGMSYRRAWLLLASLNACFSEPVALSTHGGRHGGGSVLTGFGRQLVRTYRDFEAEVQRQALQRFRALLAPPPRRERGRRASIARRSDRRRPSR